MIPKSVTLRDIRTFMSQNKQFKSILKYYPNQVSWSQFGEDIQVINLFRNTVLGNHPGFFVDVGAFHPVSLSNTFALYLQGWRGINIDAVQESVTSISQLRLQDTSICCAVRDYNGETDYFLGKNTSGESSISKDWGAGAKEKITIPCRTLNSILEEHLPQGKHIDFLSVDVEGAEEEIFAGFNLEHYLPTVIALEVKVDDIEQLLQHPLYRRLKSSNYQYKSQCGPTSIFIHKEKIISRTEQDQFELGSKHPKY